MDEQNNPNEINEPREAKPENEAAEKERKKFVIICLLIFLGSFLAVYFAVNQYMYRSELNRLRNFEQMTTNGFSPKFADFENFYKIEKEFFKQGKIRPGIKVRDITPELINSPVKIKTERDDDKYQIKVCLKAFENDPEKIKFEMRDDVLRIFGKSESVKKNVNTSVSYSQDFVLPDNAVTSEIKSYKDGNNLVIEVPLKN